MIKFRTFDSALSVLKVPAALTAVISVTLAGTAANAETLKEALAKAYLNNPTLLAARARLRAVDEGVSEAMSGWRPTVTFNYDIGRTHRDSTGTGSVSGGDQVFTPRTASISLDQNIYRGGRTVAETKQAEQNVLAQRARLATTEQEVMLAAGTAYMDVLRDEAVLKLNQNNERGSAAPIGGHP